MLTCSYADRREIWNWFIMKSEEWKKSDKRKDGAYRGSQISLEKGGSAHISWHRSPRYFISIEAN